MQVRELITALLALPMHAEVAIDDGEELADITGVDHRTHLVSWGAPHHVVTLIMGAARSLDIGDAA